MRLKKLMEKHSAILAEMEALKAAAVDETGEARAFNEDEEKKFTELEAQAKALKATIEAEERAESLKMEKAPAEPAPATMGTQSATISEEERAQDEERAFVDFVRGYATGEHRANLTRTDGGVLIPQSIANKIIDKVKDTFPVFEYATRYNVPGTLTIPYYDDSTGDITMAYAQEFQALTSTAGKFANVTLQAYLAGVLTKVSKSLINNAQFDVLNFVVNKMAENIGLWLEREIFNGFQSPATAGITGLTTATQVMNLASATVITADELIECQEMIPDAYQANCIWAMNKATRTAIRKLKDGQNNYLLNVNATTRWGYDLFGKPVYTSDQIGTLATNGTANVNKPLIWYADFSGLALKISENWDIQVLRERFADEHAIGVLAYLEADSKIENQQKIACLKTKAS